MTPTKDVGQLTEAAEINAPSGQSSRLARKGVLWRCWLVGALSRPRYLALTLPPFAVAELWSPGHDRRYLALGVFQILLLRAVSSLSNCASDQAEDARDHQRRVGFCEELGYPTLPRLVRVAVFIYVAILLCLVLVVRITGVAIALWVAFLMLKLAYSYGPRLKPRRFSATVLLGSLSAGMFTVGWFGCELTWSHSAACVAFLLWAVGSCLCGSKDAPNLEGDADVGYRSPFIRVVEREQPLAVTAVIAPGLLGRPASEYGILRQGVPTPGAVPTPLATPETVYVGYAPM